MLICCRRCHSLPYADKQALEKIYDVTRLVKRVEWEQLLDFDAPIDVELVYEFLSTFDYKEA